ncbi:MAG: aconitase X catalytic domain-containing protein [Candidatus Hermodarchaeota archaeon]
MFITKEEEKILDGESGEIKAKAMRILVTLGDIFNADKLIKVDSTQIAGVSYKTIGDAGLDFIEDWANANINVIVESWMNPAGMDLDEWNKLGFPSDFAKKQLRIIKALTSMGIKQSCTCTPYHNGLIPVMGSHIAWSESSAVIFANSVLGAMTNREGGPSALSAALIGKTPNYGLHLDENREGQIQFNINFELTNFDFTLLGYHIGELSKNKIPVINGVKKASWAQLKALGAGAAASGGVAMFIIPGITPESRIIETPEVFEVSRENLVIIQEKLTTGTEPEIITFGCPHCSLEEVNEIIQNIKTEKKVWIFTSKPIKKQFQNLPNNINIFSDTCMVVAPLEEMGIECLATDSTKAAHYTQNLSKIKSILKSREELLGGN